MKIETRKLEPKKVLRLQTDAGHYISLTAHPSGHVQVINYLAPMMDWHQHFVELQVTADRKGGLP